jgi:serine acetyltransferase/glycosyltransferase involved in cell wall biosynthesis
MRSEISVVIATHNRHASLRRLLTHLAAQSLASEAFEVVVVDDGSTEPAADHLEGTVLPAHLRIVCTARRGPGAARHEGILLANGEIVVLVDDDMQLPPHFLAAHLAAHREHPHTVVLGNILPSESLDTLPLFERYHARQLERFRAAAAAGTVPLRGVHLCTGNVSMPRARYLEVGGFNAALERSEDRELGVRLEKAGCAFVFGEAAASLHESDHTDLVVWLRRAWLYGRFDTRIARLHPDVDNTHPWRFWSLVHPASRPLIALAMAFPRLGSVLARAAYGAAARLDRAGLVRLAITLTALTYGLEYFRGMREECGSLRAVRGEVRARRRRSGRPGIMGSAAAALAAVRADYDATRRHRLKYHGEQIPAARLWLDLFRKIGFQMLASYRLMRFFREARIPLAPQLVSRFIRHAYGAEIHWDARIAPGVSIVHGIGLVLSHAAVIGEGCILFQHVTLGENFDAATGRVGAPRLERDVHVGPGAMLLGPITLGERTKVMAGAVLMRTVPADSLVHTPEAQVSARSQRTRGDVAGTVAA